MSLRIAISGWLAGGLFGSLERDQVRKSKNWLRSSSARGKSNLMARSWAGLRGWDAVVAEDIVEAIVICEDGGSCDDGMDDGTEELGVRDALKRTFVVAVRMMTPAAGKP